MACLKSPICVRSSRHRPAHLRRHAARHALLTDATLRRHPSRTSVCESTHASTSSDWSARRTDAGGAAAAALCARVATIWARLIWTWLAFALLVSYRPLARKTRVAHHNTHLRRLIDVSAKNNGHQASAICKTKPWQPLGAAQKAPGRQPRGRRRLRRNRKRIGPGPPRAAGQPLDAYSRVAAALVWATGRHVQRPGAQGRER